MWVIRTWPPYAYCPRCLWSLGRDVMMKRSSSTNSHKIHRFINALYPINRHKIIFPYSLWISIQMTESACPAYTSLTFYDPKSEYMVCCGVPHDVTTHTDPVQGYPACNRKLSFLRAIYMISCCFWNTFNNSTPMLPIFYPHSGRSSLIQPSPEQRK